MTIRTTQRMRKAMAEVRQQLIEKVQLDQVAPLVPDEWKQGKWEAQEKEALELAGKIPLTNIGDPSPLPPGAYAQESLRNHCRAVKAIEGLDIVVGSIPPDRGYDALRWSAVSAIKAARDAGMSEEDLDEFMRQQATVEGEI